MNVKKDKITSLELLKQINYYRKQEGNRVELQHKTLLEIIRDEFSDEINEQNILPVENEKDWWKISPMSKKVNGVKESYYKDIYQDCQKVGMDYIQVIKLA